MRSESLPGDFTKAKFKRWVDADRDSRDTRTEVLAKESRRRVGFQYGVLSTGRWVSVYDGATITNASKVTVDPLVPFKEAWISGAQEWSARERTAYANDLGYAASLNAVSSRSAKTRGDREPTEFLPAPPDRRCSYIKSWIAVKYRWSLTVDKAERAVLRAGLQNYCKSVLVAQPRQPNIRKLSGESAVSAPWTKLKLWQACVNWSARPGAEWYDANKADVIKTTDGYLVTVYEKQGLSDCTVAGTPSAPLVAFANIRD